MALDFELRDRILTHARDKFLQLGFSKVTLDEIASELGVSKKTLYKFYPSKEELLRASLHMNMRAVEQSLQQIVSSNKPFAEKLAETMMMLGRYIGKVSKASINDIQRFTPGPWKELERFRREQILNKLFQMVRQAREEGILRDDINDQVLVDVMLNSIQGIVNPEVLAQRSFSAEDAFRTIFKLIFEGALSDEGRKGFHLFD